MHLSIDMPWEKNLSVNASHFGPGGHYRRKPNVQAWMRELAWQVRAAVMGGHLFFGPPYKIVVGFCYPDKRVRDAENYLKVIQDAVADGLGLSKRPGMGDENIRISTGAVTVDRERPGFTIHIEDGQNARA